MIVYIILSLVFIGAGILLFKSIKKVKNAYLQFLCKVFSIVCLCIGASALYLLLAGKF